MSKPTFINSSVVYNDHSKEYNIDARGNNLEAIISACEADDVEPVEVVKENSTSIIFTKKAQKEGKEAAIIEALKNSVHGRQDKTRAFVDELHAWQNEQYIDAHYNARVMYDELAKLLPISFGYDVFKRYYNNTRT